MICARREADCNRLAPRKRRAYQACVRCVMDTTDPHIEFDDEGVCNHCRVYADLTRQAIWSQERSERELPALVDKIRTSGRGKEYDCIIGVSGGVDSTFVAYQVARLGLRTLAIHLDNGWNSTLAVTNIERTLRTLNIDLYTEVLDWREFRDLQLAFLKASTPDSEAPTDHAILATLLKQAKVHRCKYIVHGGNTQTEGILPRAWAAGGCDWKYIKNVHKQFGTVPLRTFPHFTMMGWAAAKSGVAGIRMVRLLDCLDYNKSEAMRILQRELGWEYYGGKHHESVYTRFFQSYILPLKFGIDKRRAHLSCHINAGEVTREQALKALEEPICPPELLAQDKEFVIKKLDITAEAFERIMALPARSIHDYPAYLTGVLFRLLGYCYRIPRRLKAAW